MSWRRVRHEHVFHRAACRIGLVEFDNAEVSGNCRISVVSGQNVFAAGALAVIALRDSLRDPDSLVAYTLGASTKADVVCIEYGARNGFGGMNCEVMSLKLNGKNGQTQTAQWNRVCTWSAK